MSTTQLHALSAVEAARRVYNTPSPTAEQVGRIVQKIEAGTLARGPRGGISTTAEAVANYMARKEAAQSRIHRGVDGHKEVVKFQRADDPLPTLYKGLLKDYFLAVVLRRKVSNRSGLFHGTVIATQCLLLVGMVALIWLATDLAIQGGLPSTEERAVQTWLDERYQRVEVQSVKVISRAPLRVFARYSYFTNSRRIESQRYFTLEGERVVQTSSDG